MRFDIITIFPQMFDSYLNESILKRTREKRLIEIKTHDLRRFARDKHRKVDDRPFGGGPGMVLKIEPLIKAINHAARSKIQDPRSKILVVLFSPAGKQLDDKTALRLAKNKNRLILICGRYEGVDNRLSKIVKDLGLKIENLSLGPYVLTGGELPAMVLIDAVARKIPGVLGKDNSLEEKRFGIGVPTYSRPEIFTYKKKKYKVPEVLLTGNHKRIEGWKRENAPTIKD